jgi:hypothetical protein
MRSPARLKFVASFAACALAGGLTACNGGGGSAALSPVRSAAFNAAALGASSAARYSLGLVNASPAEIAGLPQIRHLLSVSTLPSATDLSAKMPPVGNQGQEGSCVGWATAYAMRGYEARQDVWSAIAPQSADPALNFSPAFVYNQLNNGKDVGITVPAALSLLQHQGAATLADMPYVAGQYTTKPSAGAFADAAHYKLASYGSISPSDLTSMKAQLAAGLPVVLAINVYANLYALGPNQVYTGISGKLEGGHAVSVVGYDDAKGAVKFINSWGTPWGTAGYGWISYAALKQITVEAYSAIDDHGVPKPAATAYPVIVPKPLPTATPRLTTTPKPKPTPAPTAKPKPTPVPAAKPKATPTPKPSPTLKPKAAAPRQ